MQKRLFNDHHPFSNLEPISRSLCGQILGHRTSLLRRAQSSPGWGPDLKWILHQAATATEQLYEARRQRVARRDRLRLAINWLILALRGLPTERQSADGEMRRAELWDEAVLRELFDLAPEFDLNEKVGTALRSLRWLAERVIAVQETDPRQGFDWSNFPWGTWEDELRSAREMLRSMLTDLDGLIDAAPEQ